MEDITFCIWRLSSHASWQVGRIEFPDGDDPDGSESLLSILDGKAQTYKKWAEEYFARKVSLHAVKQIFAHESLTEALLHQLNADVTMTDLSDDIKKIGYPIMTGQRKKR